MISEKVEKIIGKFFDNFEIRYCCLWAKITVIAFGLVKSAKCLSKIGKSPNHHNIDPKYLH
jgi:hypothetical protein